MKNSMRVSHIINLVFGLFVISVGPMNILRGNDPVLGITFIIISILFLQYRQAIERPGKSIISVLIPIHPRLFVDLDYASCGGEC